MHPAGLAVLHARKGEDLVRLRPGHAQLNRPAPRGTMVQRNLDPVQRQRGKALVGPFYCRDGLAGEILDQSCRFKLAGRADTVQIHVGKRQAPLIIFVNHDECRAADCRWRCAQTLRDPANERRLAGSERSVERDRFPPAKHAADHLA